MSEGEVWKDAVGYEGLYKVSNKGNVYSVERISSQGVKIGGQTLKPSNNNRGGYPRLDLRRNGIRKNESVHRLVAEVFIPNPNNYPEVNHKDENKTNNNVSNLEWCTRKYNNNHGTRTEKVRQKLSKKVRAINVETGEVFRFNSIAEAVRKGYHSGSVSRACRGIYYTTGHLYKGHRWAYEEAE